MARQPKYSHAKGLINVTITGDGRIFATRKKSASKCNSCIGKAMRGKDYGTREKLLEGLKSARSDCGDDCKKHERKRKNQM